MKLHALDNQARYFLLAIIFQFVAFTMMAVDPVPHGFGPLTLWVAPILLMTGILLPAIGLTKSFSLPRWLTKAKSEPVKLVGFLLSFSISIATYLLTLEPTASLWDCSETIAAAYKLQVPHTPGTPLTLLIARLFSMLALGEVYQVAWYINLMSACFSSLAVGFIFLITWHLGSKICKNNWVLFIGSVGGAMCLAFSDSFWFSAVEAETYGPSIFFMVFLIWLSVPTGIYKEKDQKQWILLMSYLAGLAYCIHPMCILILPVCILLWRYRTHSDSWKQITLSMGLGFGYILFISKVLAVDLFEWAFKLDLLLVNQLSLPFYSGVFLLLLVLGGGIVIVWKRYQKSRLILAAALMTMMGFSPYIMLFIRSSKLPPINEFSPGNLAKIKPYMNRESYPSRPLVYGPYFDTKMVDISDRALTYVVGGNQYHSVGQVPEYHYDKERMTILPRIYSNDEAHITTYRQWTGLSVGERPRFTDNLIFMFRYQLGHMFGRYFMWNFAGRASDVQHADWLTPWQGSADRSAEEYSRAKNQYYMLPLLLGLIGLIIQLKKDRKGFLANLSFFLITGLLLAIYLNATPNEPRERDYIYVGAYTSFSIWIGLGMMSIANIFRGRAVALPALIIFCLPAWMLYQNLDDHDRSGRTFQIDHARNLLRGCEKNAVLFTGGDNDTFPLWYLQEVEGFRTDVRVKVLSYFNADWYINQLTRQYYDSPAFALTLKSGENQYGPYDPPYIHETTKSPISWARYMDALNAENPKLRLKSVSGSDYYFLPSRHITLSTSKGTVDIKAEGNYLQKSELAILDLVQTNGWDRPIYFNFTGLNSLGIDLAPYLIQEGLLYKLVPEKNTEGEMLLNAERSYRNLVVNSDYSNLSNSQVYFNHEDYNSRMIIPIKFAFNSLLENYLKEGNIKRAQELAAFAHDHIYHDHLEPSYADIQFAVFLSRLGQGSVVPRLIDRTFRFFYSRIASGLDREEIPTRGDLIVLQESARLSNNSRHSNEYEELIRRLQSTNALK